MSASWPVYCLLFGLLVVGFHQAQRFAGRSLDERKRSRRRFEDLQVSSGPTPDFDVLRRRVSRWRDVPLVGRLTRLVVQSGIRRGPGTLSAGAIGLAIAIYALLPASSGGPALRLTASLTGAGLLLWLVLRRMRARRLARFGEQLPDILDIITRSLRAGHPLPVSLALVARETPEPAGPEFRLLVDEIAYGRSVSEAVGSLYDRVGYPELRFLVASTAIAQQTGGNLGQILGRLSQTLRERFRLQRRARALSAEGRFSGYALSVLPIALFGAINLLSPTYYADFFDTSAARPVLLVCLVLMTVGNAVIYRLVNFKV